MREITLFPGESITLADGTRVVAVHTRNSGDLGVAAIPRSQREFNHAAVPDDFRALVHGLLSNGLRKADIARRLDLSRAFLSDITKPSALPWMPSYALGTALIELHREVCGTPAQEQPHA